MDWRGVHRRTTVASFVLTILLICAGAVIYRHLDRLSRLEYENQRRLLSSAMQNFRRGFEGTLLDLARAFEPPIWTQSTEGLMLQVVERYQLLLDEGADLDLIDQIFLLVFSDEEAVTFFRFHSEQRLFVEEDLPDSLLGIQRAPSRRWDPRPGGRGVSRLALLEGELYLVIPHHTEPRGFRGRLPGPFQGPPPPFQAGPRAADENPEEGPPRIFFILLELDQVSLERDVLIRLEENSFRRPLVPGFEVAIVSDTGECLFYQGNQMIDASFLRSADAVVPLVAPGGWLSPFDLAIAQREHGFHQTGLLSLVAVHDSGSLAAAISRQRTYDLLEAFGILLLLAGATATLLFSVQKTRNLARRQMDFVAGISHELRNPLTAIQSAGFNLSKGTVQEQEKIRKYGRIISKESRRLAHMVEQVLNYAGIQSSDKQYDKRFLHLEEVLEEVLQDYSEVLEEEGWEIDVQIDKDLQPLTADPKALRSCFSNLIDNSLKYAENIKSLRIKVTSEQASDKGWIHVSIQDKGRGIPGPDLPNVFEPFYRGTDHVASSKPGTGLGLSIVKSHLEAHGGKIRVESKPGLGTEFVLSFPTQISNEESDDT